MKERHFKSLLEGKLEELTNLVNDNMCNLGDTRDQCQRIAMINAIQDLEYCVNGIKDTDLRQTQEELESDWYKFCQNLGVEDPTSMEDLYERINANDSHNLLIPDGSEFKVLELIDKFEDRWNQIITEHIEPLNESEKEDLVYTLTYGDEYEITVSSMVKKYLEDHPDEAVKIRNELVEEPQALYSDQDFDLGENSESEGVKA